MTRDELRRMARTDGFSPATAEKVLDRIDELEAALRGALANENRMTAGYHGDECDCEVCARWTAVRRALSEETP